MGLHCFSARHKTFFASVLIVVAIVAGGAMVHAFGIGDLRELVTTLRQTYRAEPALIYSGLAFLDIAMIACFIPGSSLVTLASGAILGFWRGLILVTLCCPIGATLSFLIARRIFSQSVRARFPEKLKLVSRGFERGGWHYILSLRLFPGVPFVLVNLVLGVTRVPAWVFFTASLFGLIPGHAVFVFAGTRLRHLNSVDDVLSLSTLALLSMLALLPLLMRQIQKKWKRNAKGMI